MKHSWWKISIVVILMVAVAAVIAQKQRKQSERPHEQEQLTASTSVPTEQLSTPAGQPKKTVTVNAPVQSGEVCPTPPPNSKANVPIKGNSQPAGVTGTVPVVPRKTSNVPFVKPVPKTLPKLVDVGSTQCIPCKMMAPILEGLKTEYKGQFVVEFIDVNENRDAAAQYGVDTIPTQIFYDANGNEFSRHIGFFPKNDILATFAKQGITLTK